MPCDLSYQYPRSLVNKPTPLLHPPTHSDRSLFSTLVKRSDDLSHRDPPSVCLPPPLLGIHPPTQSTFCCFCNAVPLFLTTHNPHESRIPMAAIRILHWFVYRLSFSAPTHPTTAPTLVHFFAMHLVLSCLGRPHDLR